MCIGCFLVLRNVLLSWVQDVDLRCWRFADLPKNPGVLFVFALPLRFVDFTLNFAFLSQVAASASCPSRSPNGKSRWILKLSKGDWILKFLKLGFVRHRDFKSCFTCTMCLRSLPEKTKEIHDVCSWIKLSFQCQGRCEQLKAITCRSYRAKQNERMKEMFKDVKLQDIQLGQKPEHIPISRLESSQEDTIQKLNKAHQTANGTSSQRKPSSFSFQRSWRIGIALWRSAGFSMLASRQRGTCRHVTFTLC